MVTSSKPLVTPQEALEMAENFRSVDDITTVMEIVDYFYETKYFEKRERSSDRFVQLAFLAAVWNAGRVQGIREERVKRGAK